MPMTNTRKPIAEMVPSERFEGAFSIANAQMGTTRQDKPYLRCLLGDKTGSAPGRMWSIEEAAFARLATDGFVWVEGETQAYQGELQTDRPPHRPHRAHPRADSATSSPHPSGTPQRCSPRLLPSWAPSSTPP
jgi:hypothetical protein